MPYGKGTYGSKVGRPSKADKKDPKLKKGSHEKNDGYQKEVISYGRGIGFTI